MLTGKWALVTGATAGLGRAVAEGLAGAGANIVLHDLVAPGKAADEIRARFGVEAVGIAADLSRREAIETMMTTLLGRCEAIDILVNNAVVRHFAAVERFTPDAWDLALAVNLSAPFHLIRLALPAMIISETSLSFLGLGLRPPAIRWGILLQDAQSIQTLALAPWLLISAIPVILVILAFNFLGDGLRDAFDPRARI